MKRWILCALAGAAAPLTAQTIAGPPIADMSNSIAMQGRWSFAPTATGAEARFFDNGGRAQAVLTCVRATRVVAIARPAAGAAPYIQVWTTSERRNLPASYNPATGLVSAQVAAGDQLLDALAQSRGRIAIGVSGQAMLAAPAWAEIGRLVEECRS